MNEVKYYSYAIKDKWGHNSSWNVSVASTPEGEDVWGSFVNPVEQKLVFEVEIERGTVMQQLTSNKQKCLQRPSKSCCVIIGILALFCTLVGVSIYAIYAGIVPGPADWFRNGLGLSKKFKFDGSSLKCMS